MSSLKIILSSILLSSILFLGACARNNENETGENKVLAKINNYKLTVADFKCEAHLSSAGKMPDSDFEKMKEDLLDEIITKKVLIQEAQKENFDKDARFIKEIEQYWEQALLKLLYKKKTEELLREVKAKEGSDARDKKVREALNAWIEDVTAKADIKKYKDNLKAIGQQ